MRKRSNTKEFIEKATKVHGDKFDYSKVEYLGCQTKVTIICQKHGEFSVTPSSHLQGTDCPRCKGTVYYTGTDFIKSSKDKFGDYLDYSNVEYIDTKSSVKMICPIHGEFTQTPESHLQAKFPCPKCSKDAGNKQKTKTTEDFVRRSREIHGDRYDYSLSNYVNSKTKVDIICKEEGHGIFSQSVFAHLRKSGCPICAKCNAGWTKTE